MVNILRHKRSTAPMADPPVPSTTPGKSNTKLSRKYAFPLPPGSQGDARWSGESLIPSDGYSGLFASGFNQTEYSPPPRPPHHPKAPIVSATTITNPNADAKSTTPATPHRRRRSSIIHTSSTSPAKYKAGSNTLSPSSPAKRRPPNAGMDRATERRLDHIMNDLKIFAAPLPVKQSRWSSSSEESIETAPRKSGESVRSKISSKMSIKSRKSEERNRPSMDEMQIEVDVPPIPPIPVHAPVTPRRLAGLRRFLTPKKKLGPPPTPAPTWPLPIPPSEPVPEITKKSPLSTLRSIAKKSSTTTVRSVMHPTPSRTKKSSIGPPVNLPPASPSFFLDLMPRRAPTTPRKGDCDSPARVAAESTPELGFDTPRAESSFSGTPTLDTPENIPLLASASAVHVQDGTPSWTPLTAKAKVSAKMRNGRCIADLLLRQARYNAGVNLHQSGHTVADAQRPAPLRGLPPPPPSSPRHPIGILARKRVERANAELPFRNGSGDGWSTPFALSSNGNEMKVDGYFGETFGRGQRVEGLNAGTETKMNPSSAPVDNPNPSSGLNVSQRSRIDFTASPRLTKAIESDVTHVKADGAVVAGEEEAGRMSLDSEGSSMITKEEWELESHLRSIEEREVGVGR